MDWWKRARPQVLFHSPCVALECCVLVTCTLMSKCRGLHLEVCDLNTSTPPWRSPVRILLAAERKKIFNFSELQHFVFISMKYSKIMVNIIEKEKHFFQNALSVIWTMIFQITIPHLYHCTICLLAQFINSNFILPKYTFILKLMEYTNKISLKRWVQ